MIKHICPICDKVMTERHYCSFCRSWVKEPNATKIDYYLNERRPTKAANSDYHNEFMHPASPNTKKEIPEKPLKSLNSMPENSRYIQSAAQKFGSLIPQNKKVQREKSTGSWIGVAIFLLFSFFTSCI